jgi:hypothetical protein
MIHAWREMRVGTLTPGVPRGRPCAFVRHLPQVLAPGATLPGAPDSVGLLVKTRLYLGDGEEWIDI